MPLWAGWGLALGVAAACAALGHWQLQRMHAKQALLAASTQVLERREARPLAVAADAQRSRAYDWAAGGGRFADLPPVILDNQNRSSQPGVRAYRVFEPASGGLPLLVELGWLPLPGDRRMPGVARPSGDALEVSGLVLPPPSAGLASPAVQHQDDGTVLVVALDPATVAAALGLPGLAPRILRLDPALPLGYARDLELLPNTLPPDRHLGYAVQWFALAAAVLVIALVLTVRRRRR